ncbi:MAG: sigma-70 family RNA polymerase sigma factor [Planctomycetota bacterium]|jgi:RNA polymerase sigma-70 factor (ECF subfamily)|nr:sigma-70 family RNA polymerase sigma factor [Planctomycetota bacterium]
MGIHEVITLSSHELTQDAPPFQGIAEGDEEALAEWFNSHADALYAFIYYRVGNDPDLAADATQATFARALERLGDYDPERGEMTAWLRSLSRNVIRDTLAAHRKTIQLQLVWERIDESLRAVYERIDREQLPEAVLEREETRGLVGMALANLPLQYRAVLEAKYMNGHSLAAIAEMRQATIDSVKALLRRARAAFKETFLTLARTEIE